MSPRRSKTRSTQHPTKRDWQDEIREIAHGWLFDDLAGRSLPKAVILPLENPDLHDPSIFEERLEGHTPFRCIATGQHGKHAIGVMKSKFGGPAVAMTVELLARAGVELIAGIGYCGGLRNEIKSGELVIPYASIRDESTSSRFVPDSFPAVADLDLWSYAMKAESPAIRHSGVVWTTDAILLETSKDVQYWSHRGAVGVDMESATLFVLSRLHSVRSFCVLVASDNPLKRERTVLAALKIGRDRAISLVLQVLGQGLDCRHTAITR